MRGKIVRDLSASTVQVIVNQLLGLVLFYLTSMYLHKDVFGELNWSLAIASLLIAILGGGLELIIVKKIATGFDIRQMAGLHFIHVCYTSIIAAGFFFLLQISTTASESLANIFPGIIISQLISYLSSPYKQIKNGIRAFGPLAIISVTANMVKVMLLLLCLAFHVLTIQNLALLFILASIAELMVAILLTAISSQYKLLPIYWSQKKYVELIKEAVPQYGVTIFNIVLARFDWILLGLLSTAVITAEYSFAYKAFELTRLPLLILSPLLLPIFSKLLQHDQPPGLRKQTQLKLLFRTEMIVAALLPLMLIACWSPLMNRLTNYKYGSVNEPEFILLCICVPLQFATDYYWNLCFAKNKLVLTFRIALLSGIINIMLNLILIPLYAGTGAAIAYVSCFLAQIILFKIFTKEKWVKPDLSLLLTTLLCSAIALLIVHHFIDQPAIAVISVILLYLFLCILTGLIIPSKIKISAAVLLNQKKRNV